MKYLIILFAFTLNAQTFEALSVAHSVVSGYSCYFQMEDRHYYKTGDQKNKEIANKNWHFTQNLELGLSLSLGVASALKNKDDWWGYGKDLLLFSAIRWMVRDGIYNSLNGNSWFHQSNSTTAKLEPLGTWYIKLSYLITALIVYYIL